MSFTVAVTVTLNKKHSDGFMPIWNKVHLLLNGDKCDLLNLQEQLSLVKQDVNQDMNRRGLALKDVNVKIEF